MLYYCRIPGVASFLSYPRFLYTMDLFIMIKSFLQRYNRFVKFKCKFCEHSLAEFRVLILEIQTNIFLITLSQLQPTNRYISLIFDYLEVDCAQRQSGGGIIYIKVHIIYLKCGTFVFMSILPVFQLAFFLTVVSFFTA